MAVAHPSMISGVPYTLWARHDWKINKHFSMSLIGAFADPQKAAQQAYNRTKTFAYGMIYIGYSY